MDPYKRRSHTICLLTTFLSVAVLVAIGFMVALIVVLVTQNGDKTEGHLPEWPSPSTSTLGNYSTAAFAADNGKCSEIGRDIMIKGGNAMDAMIAATFCIGVMDVQSAGIGGGHFLAFYNRSSRTCLIMDARETAPGYAYKDMYVNLTDAEANRGYRSIAIPGELYGLRKAYELYGSHRVSWKELLQPTIDLCRYGYVISGALGGALDQKANDLLKEPTMKDVFFNKEAKRIYKTGEVMKRPLLADTFEQLANSDDPIQLFYHGDLAKKFIADFEADGFTNITLEDFANYTARYGPIERPAIMARINGLNLMVCGPPPPSSSAITISMLNIFSQYNVTPDFLNKNIDNNVDAYHWFIEAMKYAYAAREHLGDMDFVPSALDLANNFTSDEFAKEAKSRITATSHQNQSDYYFWNEQIGTPAEDHGTAHMSAIDSDGNAASLTTTTNLFFGSMKRSMSTDIIWNDDMADFSTPGTPNTYGYAPTPFNYIEPGKRPLSSMCPLIFFDATTGDVRLVAGGAGGSRIISATANSVMRTLWFGQNVKEAVDSPRLHNQLKPFQTEFEYGFPQVYLDLLTAKGQNFTKYSDDPASTCVVARDKGRIYANSDYRKVGGYTAGY